MTDIPAFNLDEENNHNEAEEGNENHDLDFPTEVDLDSSNLDLGNYKTTNL